MPGSVSGVRAVAAAALTAGTALEVIVRRHDEESSGGIEVAVVTVGRSEVVGRHRGLGDWLIAGTAGHPFSIPMLK